MPIPVQVTQVGLEASIKAAAAAAGRNLKVNVASQEAARKTGRNLGIDLGANSRSIDSLSRPLGKITGQADEFTKSMEAANARVLAFGASVGVLAGVVNGFQSLVRTTIEVEKTMANINSVLGKSASELDKFKSEIFDVARATGSSFETVSTAALELSRQGLNSTEVISRLNDAMILSRLSGLGAAESVDGLTAAFNSFKDQGETSATILNKVAAAAAAYAVSEKDLIEGIKRSGSVAQQAGVNLNELASIITAVQERTSAGGAVIGNSFKTIFTRIGKEDTLTALKGLGIEITDVSGRILPATKLLENLAQKIDGLSQLQISEITQKVGGGFQIDKLLASLKDMSSESSVFKGTMKELESAGDKAYSRNIALNETLAASINTAGINLKELANTLGEIGITGNLNSLLSFFNSFAEGVQGILDGEGIGSRLAKGIVKGIGDIISGPGLAIFGAVIIKLSYDLIKFGTASLKSFFGVNQASKEMATLQGTIANALLNNKKIQSDILALEGDRIAQAKYFSVALDTQIAKMNQMRAIAADITPEVMRNTPILKGKKASGSADGYVPTAAEGYAPAVAQESANIKKGVGGARPSDRPVVIPNFSFGGGKTGAMVAHTGEHIVKNYGGSGGSAVFNRDMVKSMGLPNGAQKIGSAGGFIPNFGLERVDKTVVTDTYKYTYLSELKRLIKNPEYIDRKKKRKRSADDLLLEKEYKLKLAKSNQKALQKEEKRFVGNAKNFAMLVPTIQKSQDIPITDGVFKKGETKIPFTLKNLKIRGPFPKNIGEAANPQDEKLKDNIRESIVNFSTAYAGTLGFGKADSSKISDLLQTNSGAVGAISGAVGAGFEAAVMSKIQTSTFTQEKIKKLNKEGGDFDIRGATDDVNTLFNLKGISIMDFKSGDSPDNIASFAKKIYNLENKDKKLDKKLAVQVTNPPLNTETKTSASGYIPNFASGFVPQKGHYFYDKYKLKTELQKPVLDAILRTPATKQKDGLIGPVGSGKSTIASGPFIQSMEDVKKAKSFTLISSSSLAKKEGGISDEFRLSLKAIKDSKGILTYLNVDDDEIKRRREINIARGSNDARSEGQLKGSVYAPLNQPEFIKILEKEMGGKKNFKIKDAAKGFVPNFVSKSRSLGKGYFGEFHKLGEKEIDGVSVPIGVKRFKTDTKDKREDLETNIETEYLIARLISEHPLVAGITGPKVFGTLEESLRRKSIRKEVINDKLGANAIGRYGNVFGKIIGNTLRRKGLDMTDLHAGNYTVNSAGEDALNQNDQFYLKANEPSSMTKESVAFAENFSSKGGIVNIIDAGDTIVKRKYLEDKIEKYLQIPQKPQKPQVQKNAAKGFVPNFAKLIRNEELYNLSSVLDKDAKPEILYRGLNISNATANVGYFNEPDALDFLNDEKPRTQFNPKNLIDKGEYGKILRKSAPQSFSPEYAQDTGTTNARGGVLPFSTDFNVALAFAGGTSTVNNRPDLNKLLTDKKVYQLDSKQEAESLAKIAYKFHLASGLRYSTGYKNKEKKRNKYEDLILKKYKRFKIPDLLSKMKGIIFKKNIKNNKFYDYPEYLEAHNDALAVNDDPKVKNKEPIILDLRKKSAFPHENEVRALGRLGNIETAYALYQASNGFIPQIRKGIKYQDLDILNSSIGGSTGAKLVLDKISNQKLILKSGANQKQVFSEARANSLFKKMGENVPNMQIIRGPDNERLLLSSYIEGQSLRNFLNSANETDKNSMMDKLNSGYTKTALLADHDWAGFSQDNIIVDKKQNPFRVDVGGALDSRAQGASKSFGSTVTEMSSLKAYGGQFFKNISKEQVQEQINEIVKNKDSIIAGGGKYRETLKARIDYLKGYVPNFADPLKSAISREISAGVDPSQVYVDRNNSLKNPTNPMGLMVANRRDEPANGFQGITRARKEGQNAQTYGSAKGFVPNFAKKDFSTMNVARYTGIALAQMDIDPRTVLREMVQNAFAHGQTGESKGVYVQKNTNSSLIGVSDKGVGMSPEDVFTKFLPFAETGNPEENKGLSGFGMGKSSIFLGSKKFFLDTVKDVKGKKVRTKLVGTPKGWDDFVKKKSISLDEKFFDAPQGSLIQEGLRLQWRTLKEGADIEGTTIASRLKREGGFSYGQIESIGINRTGEIAKIPFYSGSNDKDPIMSSLRERSRRPLIGAIGGGGSKRGYNYEPRDAEVQETINAEGGKVDILFDSNSPLRKTYGQANVPILSEGMQYASQTVAGVDFVPEGLMINVKSNVPATDEKYPWNTDRTVLRGPVGKAAANAIRNISQKLKDIQMGQVENATSNPFGPEMEFMDVSSSLEAPLLREISGNKKFQGFGAALKKVFDDLVKESAKNFDPRMKNAKMKGLAIGADWMGLNVAKRDDNSTQSLIAPFSHVDAVVQRIKKLKGTKGNTNFRNMYSREILNTTVHEAAHQTNRTEGQGHAEAMAGVWAANAEKVGDYLRQIERSLDPELMRYIIKTHKQTRNMIDLKKSDAFTQMVGESANGFVPNFADPLKDAISREVGAGVNPSQVYVDQHSSLKNSGNPMGLMVANRRDEPSGGFQGIARARKEGQNAQTYGAVNGFVPNFANVKTVEKLSQSVASATGIQINAGAGEDAINEFATNAKKAGASMKKLSNLLESELINLGVDPATAKKLTVASVNEVRARNELVTQLIAESKLKSAQSRLKTANSVLEDAANKKLKEAIDRQIDAYNKSAKTKKDLNSLKSSIGSSADQAGLSNRQSLSLKASASELAKKAELDPSKSTEGVVGKLILFQTVTAGLTGLFDGLGGKVGKFGEALTGVTGAILSIALLKSSIGPGPSPFAGAIDKVKNSKAGEAIGAVGGGIVGKTAGFLGGLAGGLGKLLPYVGIAIFAFQALGPVLKLFGVDMGSMMKKFGQFIGVLDSPAKEAANKLRELGKVDISNITEGNFSTQGPSALATFLQGQNAAIRAEKAGLKLKDAEDKPKDAATLNKELLEKEFGYASFNVNKKLYAERSDLSADELQAQYTKGGDKRFQKTTTEDLYYTNSLNQTSEFIGRKEVYKGVSNAQAEAISSLDVTIAKFASKQAQREFVTAKESGFSPQQMGPYIEKLINSGIENIGANKVKEIKNRLTGSGDFTDEEINKELVKENIALQKQQAQGVAKLNYEEKINLEIAQLRLESSIKLKMANIDLPTAQDSALTIEKELLNVTDARRVSIEKEIESRSRGKELLKSQVESVKGLTVNSKELLDQLQTDPNNDVLVKNWDKVSGIVGKYADTLMETGSLSSAEAAIQKDITSIFGDKKEIADKLFEIINKTTESNKNLFDVETRRLDINRKNNAITEAQNYFITLQNAKKQEGLDIDLRAIANAEKLNSVNDRIFKARAEGIKSITSKDVGDKIDKISNNRERASAVNSTANEQKKILADVKKDLIKTVIDKKLPEKLNSEISGAKSIDALKPIAIAIAKAEREAAIMKLDAAFKDQKMVIDSSKYFYDTVKKAAEELAMTLGQKPITYQDLINKKADELKNASPASKLSLVKELNELTSSANAASGTAELSLIQSSIQRKNELSSAPISSETSNRVQDASDAIANSFEELTAKLEELNPAYSDAKKALENNFTKSLLNFENKLSKVEFSNVKLNTQKELSSARIQEKIDNPETYIGTKTEDDYLAKKQSLEMQKLISDQSFQSKIDNNTAAVELERKLYTLENITAIKDNSQVIRDLIAKIQEQQAGNQIGVSNSATAIPSSLVFKAQSALDNPFNNIFKDVNNQASNCAKVIRIFAESLGISIEGATDVANSFQRVGIAVDKSQIKAGDVLIKSGGKGPDEAGGHVGMYLGENRVMQANQAAFDGNPNTKQQKAAITSYNPSEWDMAQRPTSLINPSVMSQADSKQYASIDPEIIKKAVVGVMELNVEFDKIPEAALKAAGNMNLQEEAQQRVAGVIAETVRQSQLRNLKDKEAIKYAEDLFKIKNQGANSSFAGGYDEGIRNLNRQTENFSFSLGERVPQMFSDNMANAMEEIILKGGDVGDVLMDAATSFLNEINKATFKNIADKIVSGQGGSIFKFASGGKITGGSGNKDDVPAMLMGGEFVMNKKAVSKYGDSFMEKINKGSISHFAKGGKVEDAEFISERGLGTQAANNQYPSTQTGKGGFFTPGLMGSGSITGKKDLLNFATQSYTSGENDIIKSGKNSASIDLETESVRLTNFGRRNGPQAQALKEAKSQSFDVYKQQLDQEKQIKEAQEAYDKERKAKIKGLLTQIGVSAAMFGASTAANGINAAKIEAKGLNLTGMDANKFALAGAFKGGNIDGTNVGGLGNLFKGNFALSQISNKSQLSDYYDSKTPKPSNNLNYANNFADTSSGAFDSTNINMGQGRTYGSFSGGDDIPNIPLTKRATGGQVPRTAGIDTVSTMLSGGEFVMNASATSRIGPEKLNQMNSGATQTSNVDSEALNEKLISKLDELIEASKTKAGSVTVNVSSDGSSQTSSSKDQTEQDKNLSEKIKNSVLQVIAQEKRMGGMLAR